MPNQVGHDSEGCRSLRLTSRNGDFVAALDIPLSPGFARCRAPRTSPPACGGGNSHRDLLGAVHLAHPRPACGGALQTKNRVSRSSKLVATLCFWFAVRGGFEPPVREIRTAV